MQLCNSIRDSKTSLVIFTSPTGSTPNFGDDNAKSHEAGCHLNGRMHNYVEFYAEMLVDATLFHEAHQHQWHLDDWPS